MSIEQLFQQALKKEQSGNLSEAVILYKQLATKKDPRYLIAFGICLKKLKYWKESIKYLKKGIDLKPKYGEGDARLFLAEAYIGSGNKKKAIEQWKIALKLEPQYPSYEHVQNEAKKNLAKHA